MNHRNPLFWMLVIGRGQSEQVGQKANVIQGADIPKLDNGQHASDWLALTKSHTA